MKNLVQTETQAYHLCNILLASFQDPEYHNTALQPFQMLFSMTRIVFKLIKIDNFSVLLSFAVVPIGLKT